MFLKMNNLTEALEKKYSIEKNDKQTLNESVKMNEKFDDSMPKWLKDRIAYSSISSGDSSVKNPLNSRRRRTRSGNPFAADIKYPNQFRITGQKNRSTGESGGELGLARQFLNQGVDISKIKIHEAPIPDKIPRRTKNQQIIPIFHLPNGQVWAVGINDREEYQMTREPFSRSKQQVLDDCVDYAYIDLNDENIDTVGEIRKKRAELKQELNKIPNYYRNDSWNNWDADKSGYSNKVNTKRYKEIAKKLKYKKLPSLIEDCGIQITEYKEQITDILEELDMFEDDSKTNGILNKLIDALRNLRDANTCYTDALSALDRFNNEPDQTYIADNVIDCIKRAQRELSIIDNKLKAYMKITADW